ncbi:MAG TPA: hypothetical protein VN736_30680 [Candidatus Limnocylindrales bacterium]|nr:hypothetical protein [Candidatus Limnocylindrales bacterium]
MTGHGSKFGRKKEEAIHALLSSRSVEDAAEAAGVARTTLLRWLKVPEFQAAYREARRAAVSQANARLQQASSAAAATLLRIMLDPQAPAAARVRAATRVLDAARYTLESEDLEVRLSALEDAVQP